MEYTHPTLPLKATEAAWGAIGARTGTDGSLSTTDCPYAIRPILALALARGLSGDAAVAWAAEEYRRRKEADATVRAECANAAALRDLAGAIRTSAESEVLARILPRLTDRTQHAVRAQLGD